MVCRCFQALSLAKAVQNQNALQRASLKQPVLDISFLFPKTFVVADVKAVTLGQAQ